MIKVENIDVHGFEAAIRGMRNPKNSWGRSDSEIGKCNISGSYQCKNCAYKNVDSKVRVCIGSNDLDLMQRLYKGGTEHRKYLRMINVTMDITAPLYWWKEFDTYKVGTVANSCSTMHKIHDKEFMLEEDFSYEHLLGYNRECMVDELGDDYYQDCPVDILEQTIAMLNKARELYLETKDKKYWWQMIQSLPTSYNQRRTVQLSYETVFNIIRQREHHKLDEWPQFVEILKQLPYVEELYEYGVNKYKELMNDIRTKAIDEFATTLIPRLTDAIYPQDVEGMTNLINDVASELKAGVKNE